MALLDDLDIDVGVAAGRLLTPEDLKEKPAGLQRLTHRHHALAKALAQGMSNIDAALTCGYAPGTVSALKTDPTFLELVKKYQADVNFVYRGIHESLIGLAKDAADEIASRLENEPEKIPLPQLMEITKLAADRAGFGPSSKTETNVNVNIGSRLDEARERARLKALEASNAAKVINPDGSEV